MSRIRSRAFVDIRREHAHCQEESNDVTFAEINATLKELQTATPGVEACALISEHGLVIASALPQDVEEIRSLALVERGRRVLLVDLDPQGAIGHSLLAGEDKLAGLLELLFGDVAAAGAILRTKIPTLSILPRGRLDPADAWAYEEALLQNNRLGNALAQADAGAEITILDTPAGVGRTTRLPPSWDELLERFLADSGALAAFITDMGGLIIAHRGALLEEEVQALGAPLVAADVQIGRMSMSGKPASTFALRLGDSWLTAFRIPVRDGGFLMACIVGEMVAEERMELALRASVQRRVH